MRQHSHSRNRSAREETLEQCVEEEDVAGCKRVMVLTKLLVFFFNIIT